jgi:hypothetical protein
MRSLLILLFTSIVLLACKKKEDKPILPPATQTGANTFGCYVDGKPYAIFEGDPKDDWYNPDRVIFDDFNNINKLFISVQKDNPRWWFDIEIDLSQNINGAYYSKGWPFYSEFKDADGNGSIPLPSNLYKTNDSNYLTVHITKSITGKQYSGTFSGTMKNDAGKVITITDGRFDIGK